MGAPTVLGAYYPDLTDPRFETIGAFGHNRYSTNTWPSFKRVQPFSALGHNGEINTIEQLRQEAKMLAVQITPGASDSQDLNLTIDTMVSREGLSLAEAMEMVLPPIVEEIRNTPRGAAGLLHVPASGDGAVLAGPGRADRPPRRRVRLLRRRDGPAPALEGRDRVRPRLQLRARRRLGPRHGLRAAADGAGREGDGADRPRRADRDPAPARGDAADGPRALAGPQRGRRGGPVRARAGDRRPARGRRRPRLLGRRPGRAGQGRRPRPRRLRLAARRRQTRPADGLQRGRADRLAGLRRPAGGALAGAAEPRRLLQGDGRRRHQPGA